MKKTIRKNIEMGVLFGLICAIVLSFANFEVRCDQLRQNVLRLHIIANSNSEADQTLKLAVRDEILKNSTDIFKECNNIDSALITASTQTETLNSIANTVIEQNGFDYSAEVSVGDSYFETREYDDFTLPAGTYKSLIVKLGKGEGKNWWCVVFPCVCVPSATDAQLSDSVPQSAAQTAENGEKYVLKFKSAEIYEQIKKIFSKNE
ncbi:MAG: stage II sporulation protein R [Acutalibacteraceae bacterium]|nr:stage II sporulation protein R [Acutalibacteraceae bacterium]